MSKQLQYIKQKLGFLGAVFSAAVVGALVPGIVRAAIPNSNNDQISSCYRNSSGSTTKGSLRVIDAQNGETCTAQETALSWGQNKVGTMLSNLVGADFTDANLVYRNFYGVDMHGSIFSNTNLSGSDLRNANLSGSNPFSANMKNVNAQGLNLSNAQIDSLYGENGDFRNSNLANSIINNLDIGDFRGSNFNSATIHQISNANLSGIDLRLALMPGSGTATYGIFATDLTSANFSGFHFTDRFNFDVSNLTFANFSNAIFDSPSNPWYSFGSANLSNTNFSNVAFHDFNFFGATNMNTSNLSGVTWSNVMCPDGVNSDTNGNTCTGHLIP